MAREDFGWSCSGNRNIGHMWETYFDGEAISSLLRACGDRSGCQFKGWIRERDNNYRAHRTVEAFEELSAGGVRLLPIRASAWHTTRQRLLRTGVPALRLWDPNGYLMVMAEMGVDQDLCRSSALYSSLIQCVVATQPQVRGPFLLGDHFDPDEGRSRIAASLHSAPANYRVGKVLVPSANPRRRLCTLGEHSTYWSIHHYCPVHKELTDSPYEEWGAYEHIEMVIYDLARERDLLIVAHSNGSTAHTWRVAA